MIASGATWVVCLPPMEASFALLAKAPSFGRQVIALCVDPAQASEYYIHAGADIVALLDCGADDCQNGTMIADILACYTPDIVLFPATIRGRALSAWVASKLQTGLTADCTALSINEDGLLLQTRPAFGGNLMADILCRTARPQMASVRPGVFPAPGLDTTRNGEIIPLHAPDASQRLTRISSAPLAETERLSDADVIVAGGKGIGSPEGFARLERLAELLGGSTAASRAAVDAGWVPHAMQVGQTGTSVRPRLYIAVGISGAIQHVIGIEGARTVIAINEDPRAQIFMHANYGIACDWRDAVDQWIDALERRQAP